MNGQWRPRRSVLAFWAGGKTNVEFVRPRSLAGGERRAKAPRACPYCGRLVSLSTPHVQVARSGVRLFCSADCMEAALQGWPRAAQPVHTHAAHAGEPPPQVLI